MNITLHHVQIVDPAGPHHGQTADIRIENGTITAIGTGLDAPEDEAVTFDNACVSPGWFDSSVSFGEPGFEERETIANGLHTAARSGFTAVALQPNSYPVIDNQSQVRFVQTQADTSATRLYPIGALTKNSEGAELAELYDMQRAGAVAFGDYGKSLDNANLLKTALQYVQDFDGRVIAFCQDTYLKGKGFVNEGIVATRLGMKGIPALAEELQVARNLFLLEYTGGRLHLPTLSTARSVALVREAKAKGLQVTCSVTIHHLVLTDEQLDSFDTRYKVTPPLRTEADRKALVEAVLDGTVDMITSDHNPLDIELKKLEFDLAKSGTIGLESAFGALLNVLPVDVIVSKLVNGRDAFGLPRPTVAVGAQADLTLFTTKGERAFSATDILSKSKNAIFLNQPMKGRVYGVYAQQKLVINGH